MKMNLTKCKTHYSLLESLIKPDKLASELQSRGYSGCAITDSRSISGSVEFYSELKKKNIKTVFGSEFRTSLGDIVVLAKNKQGWFDLVKLTSLSNDLIKLIHDKPTLSITDFNNFNNFICLVGHFNTILFNAIFSSLNVFNIKDKANAAKYIKPSWREEANFIIKLLKDLFGKENVFIEIQKRANCVGEEIASEILKGLAIVNEVKTVASADPHYFSPAQHSDNKLQLASQLKTTLKKLPTEIDRNQDLLSLYSSSLNHIPNFEEFSQWNTEEEIENTNLIFSMCEDYSILNKPRTPKFECPNNLSELEYLKQLARNGYSKRRKTSWNEQLYGDRAKHELAVIEKAGLEGYFLIVQDYINWCKQNKILCGPARGSSAGSIISYFIGITDVDPIPFSLIFERFYNEGRNTKEHISYPDIDADFPIGERENVINYIRNKYGNEHVSQIVTFGRQQGRGALKEVLRVHSACDMHTMNLITEKIPQEHQISDKLEEEHQESIIQWTLDNEPEKISDYCRVTEGQLTGDFAQYFEQAIRIEGTYRSQGKHAAGLIISSEILANVCPMVHDKSSDNKIAGWEMESMEKAGHLKFDILGVAPLDKLMKVNELLC